MEELMEEINQLLLEIEALSDSNPTVQSLLKEKRERLKTLQDIANDTSIVDVSNALSNLKTNTQLYFEALHSLYIRQEEYKRLAEADMNNILSSTNFKYPNEVYSNVFAEQAITMLYGVTKKGFKLNWLHTIFNTLQNNESRKKLKIEFDQVNAAIIREHNAILAAVKDMEKVEIMGNHLKKYYMDIGQFIYNSSLLNHEKVLMIDRLSTELSKRIDKFQQPANNTDDNFESYLKPLIMKFVASECCFHQVYGTLQTIGTNALGEENVVIKTEVDFNRPLHTRLKKDGQVVYRVLTKLNEYNITLEDNFIPTKSLQKYFPGVCIINEHDHSVITKIDPRRGDRHRQIKEF